jgi:ferredoxin
VDDGKSAGHEDVEMPGHGESPLSVREGQDERDSYSTSPVTLLEWRSLFRPRRVEKPTYTADLIGPIGRFDERDCMFARMDLQPGTTRYDSYYLAHEESQAADDFLRAMPPLGSTAAPRDAAILQGLFQWILATGRHSEVDGSADATPEPTESGSVPVLLPPDEASARLKSVAVRLGADLVGIGPLGPTFTYSHVGRTRYGQSWGEEINLHHPHAVSVGIAMDYQFLQRHAPGFPVILESGLAYARAASIALQLATYIRALGYSARAHHLRDYQLLCVPVAVDCGLGEMGRSGVLLTREFGSTVRLATVTTDLPLAMDGPVDLGIQQFCEKCRLCAMACPAGAIPQGGKSAVRGVKRWKLAAGRCYHYWRTCGSDCALCVVACPWSRPDKETKNLRPIRPEPVLDPETIAASQRIRETLPAWLQRYLGRAVSLHPLHHK